ncbi:conserved hypothetical protein [Culex quinquefasciatus]|uniref:Defective proboscis extension response n=1 Tax=Culex quinquefasciatus TaxID=7176 RepID=B0WYJ0_CULQU|nr:conserved hypothetical protein [Culex quinquefasciatus]|eukprot:XP_001862462.1 conserved hypothetical protein [Culex quinquefasciatus]
MLPFPSNGPGSMEDGLETDGLQRDEHGSLAHLETMRHIVVVMIFLNVNNGISSPSQTVDIDEPHTYTPPKHYFQTSSFDEADLDGPEGDGIARNPLDRGPYFDISASRNVTALVGNTAYLNCRVRNLGNRTVLYPQPRDSGVYECQISTTPPVGYSMTLSVVGKLWRKTERSVTPTPLVVDSV